MIEPKTIVLDNKLVTIWYYPTVKIIHHQFHHYTFGEPFREILMTALEAFEKHRCIKWLSDDRKFGALLPEDKAWGDAVWRPRVLEAGWKYWAMVLPGKVTGQMNIQKMVEEYAAMGVITKVHSDPEEAMKWLIDQT